MEHSTSTSTSTSSTTTPKFNGLTPSQALNGKSGNGNQPKRRPNNAPATNGNNGVESSSGAASNNGNGNGNKEQAPSNNTNNGEGKKKKKRPARRRNKAAAAPANGTQTEDAQNQSDGKQPQAKPKDDEPTATTNRRQRGKKGNKGNNANANTNANARTEDANGNASQDPKPKGRNVRNRNRNQRKKYPWRRLIPQGTVDPITLEELITLSYPPFALVSDGEPYVPVPVWPVPDPEEEKEEPSMEDDLEELNRWRIQEQWGQSLATLHEQQKQKEATPDIPEQPAKQRYYNLYDGRALAYYLVSQLQFIDPLNRRDLTRGELLNLDDYLQRHGFNHLRVTDAYDAKGITLSTAGATASTAQGRADILQQTASNLLRSLFGGAIDQSPNANQTSTTSTTALQDQYAALRLQEEALARQREQHRVGGLNPNAAPFGGNGASTSEDHVGFTVIDDDENPGMRGGDGGGNSNPFYSANHITNRYGGGGRTTSGSAADAFPALGPLRPSSAAHETASIAAAIAASIATTTTTTAAKLAPKRYNKTLSRITGAVKKTDPDEAQRQWEAREESRKRALLSNLSFGFDATKMNATQPPSGLTASSMSANANLPVSDDKLERNRALADALGVKPATVRNAHQFNAGWARPTSTDTGETSLDEFGNELNNAAYPESLIANAKERMGLLLKLEKKWTAFLTDDTSASMPLNAMDRPSRKFVHHYSDFWNLRTESFDPEPKRYIHCVKMIDTHMPHSLLSDTARNYRGPLITNLPSAGQGSDHTSQQTAGQSTGTRSREMPPPPDRMPLALKPRSLPPGEQKPDNPNAKPSMTEEGTVATTEQPNSRFNALFAGRERPKFELAKRTVPLELPPFKPENKGQGFNAAAEDLQQRQARSEEKARKEREAAEKKRRVLEQAFASDDEDDRGAQSSGSEWDEPEPLYTGNDFDDEE